MTDKEIIEGMKLILEFYANMIKSAHMADCMFPNLQKLEPFWRERHTIVTAAIKRLEEIPQKATEEMVEAFKAQWWRLTGRKASWPDLDNTILGALDAALAVYGKIK